MESNFIFDNLWILFVIGTVINGATMWFSSRKYRKEKPELKAGYHKFIKGFMLIGNIPWAIMGIGALTNTVENTFDFFNPSELNPVVLLFHASIVGIWIYVYRLVYYGNGAEFIEKHPGLIRFKAVGKSYNLTAKQVRIFLPIALIGGGIALIVMWIYDFPTPI